MLAMIRWSATPSRARGACAFSTPRRAVVALIAVLATWPTQASAGDDERGRPWARGTALPTFGFGVGLGRDVTSLHFALGGRYFVTHGLAVGLTLSDSVSIFSSRLKSEYPGIEKQIPTNVFEITPSLQYVFFRSRWFSPYAYAGVGPSFFNNRRGTFGHWTAGPGAYIRLGGPVFLDVGVGFRGLFPVARCNDAFEYVSGGEAVQLSSRCAFGWGPNIGLVVAFGGPRAGKRREAPPPSNPYETVTPSPPTNEPDAPTADPWEEIPAAEPTAPAPSGPASRPSPESPPSPVSPPGPATPPGPASPSGAQTEPTTSPSPQVPTPSDAAPRSPPPRDTPPSIVPPPTG